jgi:peptidoglycan hydrolase CwlO-like protein
MTTAPKSVQDVMTKKSVPSNSSLRDTETEMETQISALQSTVTSLQEELQSSSAIIELLSAKMTEMEEKVYGK